MTAPRNQRNSEWDGVDIRFYDDSNTDKKEDNVSESSYDIISLTIDNNNVLEYKSDERNKMDKLSDKRSDSFLNISLNDSEEHGCTRRLSSSYCVVRTNMNNIFKLQTNF